MKTLRIRAIPIARPASTPASSPSSAPGGGGGGGGDDATSDPDPSGGAEPPEAADVDVEGVSAGTFGGVPLWQWLVLGAALVWARKG